MPITSLLLNQIKWSTHESCSTRRDEENGTLDGGQLAVVWPKNVLKGEVLTEKFGKATPSYFLRFKRKHSLKQASI